MPLASIDSRLLAGVCGGASTVENAICAIRGRVDAFVNGGSVADAEARCHVDLHKPVQYPQLSRRFPFV